jgi:hypothetical protein
MEIDAFDHSANHRRSAEPSLRSPAAFVGPGAGSQFVIPVLVAGPGKGISMEDLVPGFSQQKTPLGPFREVERGNFAGPRRGKLWRQGIRWWQHWLAQAENAC